MSIRRICGPLTFGCLAATLLFTSVNAEGSVIDTLYYLSSGGQAATLVSGNPTYSSSAADPEGVGLVVGGYPGFNAEAPYRAVIQFGSLDNFASVDNATFQVDIVSYFHSGYHSWSIHQITSPWTTGDGGASWSNAPTFNPTPAVTQLVPVAPGTVTFDVTSLVQSWVSGASPNYGFLLKADSELPTNDRAGLDPSGTGGAGPRLTVTGTYVPEPGTASLAALLFGSALFRRSRRA